MGGVRVLEEREVQEKVARYLDRIEKKDGEINAFIELNDRALEAAKEVDKKIARGKAGKLAGYVVGIKSNINVLGLKATCASKTLENYVSPYNATVVQRIKEEDGVIIGMTNMDEFACGSSGETSYFGEIQNPYAKGRIPGGSSAGSAAAVAANFCDVALGSDTGGSIRNPSSHCGVVGVKPTYGRVSRYGLIDLAMSLEQIGPFAGCVRDAALLLEVIAGHDPREGTTLKAPAEEYSSNLSSDLSGWKIGFAREFEEFTDPRIVREIKRGLDRLSSNGAEIVEVTLPNLGKALPTYYLTVFVEFFSATRKFDGRRYGYRIEDVCGREVLRRIMLGRYISQKEYSGKYYKKALQFRSLIKRELLDALGKVSVIAGPTVPKLPHKLGEKIEDPLTMYGYDVLTVPTNLAGIPAGVVNVGKARGIPVGMQIQGKPLEEQMVLNALYALEKR
jgi:aspartyl-tRNA(Asn)/glutamyl-tRNA(Gln) amidotransferase subunit A